MFSGTHNHLQSTGSHEDLVVFTDGRLSVTAGSAGTPRILLMDLAPIHIAAVHIMLMFLPLGSRGTCLAVGDPSFLFRTVPPFFFSLSSISFFLVSLSFPFLSLSLLLSFSQSLSVSLCLSLFLSLCESACTLHSCTVPTSLQALDHDEELKTVKVSRLPMMFNCTQTRHFCTPAHLLPLFSDLSDSLDHSPNAFALAQGLP